MITLRKKEKKKCIGRIGPRNTKLIENKKKKDKQTRNGFERRIRASEGFD